MNNDSKQWLLPRNKEGSPDHRFEESFSRILDEIGDETHSRLRQFSIETSHLQRQSSKAGLDLAIAIFNEANYLDANCRYQPDNQYGWRSKLLRKQAQLILETIGFKRNNANKLVKTAEWLTKKLFNSEERQWLYSLTPSHIYELSRLSAEGFEAVKLEVSYQGFTFAAGQREISVRRLEELRRLHSVPIAIEPEGKLIEMDKLIPSIDSKDASSHDLLEQIIDLVKSIDWVSLKSNPALSKRLKAEQELLRQLLVETEVFDCF
ncbi:hypothetical protein N9N71_03750 [Synechococcus sp. AH-229-G18]|nr:hypothetical protein [Synechococcus sp. AH-229-G18]